MTAIDPNAATHSARTQADKVAALHRRWILEGWEKKPGDGPWTFRNKLDEFYDGSGDRLALYDTFDPQHRVGRSAADYAAMFEPPFQAMRSALHAVTDGPDVVAPREAVPGAVAGSTLEFAARLEGADGTLTGVLARSNLVWRHDGEAWRIVQEHNSTRIVPVEEVDRLLAEPAA